MVLCCYIRNQKAKINSNGAGTYSANNVVQKIKFIELLILKDEGVYSVKSNVGIKKCLLIELYISRN